MLFHHLGTRLGILLIFVFGWFGQAITVAQDSNEENQQLFAEVSELVENRQFQEASRMLGEIIRRDEDNAEAWQMLGYTLQVAGDLDKAIVIHKKAATYEPAKIAALYNLGCAYALKGDEDMSIQYLERAVEAGFGDADLMIDDPELTSVRSLPRFVWLVDRLTTAPPVSYFRPTSLEGEWLVDAGAYVGKKLTTDQLPIPTLITRDRIELDVAGKEIVMKYKLDLSIRPVEIDLTFLKGKTKNRFCKGIVEFNGDNVVLCYQSTGGIRPLQFESSPNDGNVLLKLSKKDALIDRERLLGEWQFERGFRGSKSIDKNRLVLGITIGEREIRLPGTDGKYLTVHYQIDSTKTPASIDMVMVDPETRQRVSNGLGIVLLAKQRLMICYDPKGNVRPKKFASTKKDGFFLFTLTKAN